MTVRDVAWAGLAAAVVAWTAWSLVGIALDPGSRTLVVALIEVATWLLAAGAVATFAWRRTRWGG